MREGKNIAVLAGLVLSVSLLTASVTAMLVAYYDNRMYFRMSGSILQEIVEKQPKAEQEIGRAHV